MSRTRGEEKQRFKVIFGRRPSSCNRNGKTSKLHQTSKCYWSSVCFMRKCFGGEETAKGRRGRESRPVKCAINKTREPEVEQLSTDSLPCPTSWCRRDTSLCFQGEMYYKDKGGKKKQKWMTSDLEKANAVNAVHLCMAVLCVFLKLFYRDPRPRSTICYNSEEMKLIFSLLSWNLMQRKARDEYARSFFYKVGKGANTGKFLWDFKRLTKCFQLNCGWAQSTAT